MRELEKRCIPVFESGLEELVKRHVSFQCEQKNSRTNVEVRG
jgi:hypothetical protein